MTSVSHIELTSENLKEHERTIIKKLVHARHVAIDTEFTGHLRSHARNMEQRYEDLATVVRSNAVVALGLTIIQTDNSFVSYDIILFNEAIHEVDPSNLRFLALHGFDFNRQYRYGLSYRPGVCNDSETKDGDGRIRQLLGRNLWIKIHRILFNKKIPVVVHNGLIDLMYIYQSFITTLPPKLQAFVEDMSEAFPGGVYDTKYLSMYILNEQATFLAYLYCKYERLHRNKRALDNNEVASAKRQRMMGGVFSNTIPLCLPPVPSKVVGQLLAICNDYAARGYCKGGTDCKRSHDLERIIDRDLKVTTPSTDPIPIRSDHSAYYDAYMTGFIFNRMREQLGDKALAEHINKLNLMRLDIPLRIVSSAYAKPSHGWLEAKKRLQYQYEQPSLSQSSSTS